jgi:amino acid adenylation domain-containing protein
MYVPLDTGSPGVRLARMVRMAEPRLLLAAGTVAVLLEELLDAEGVDRDLPVGWLDASVRASGAGRIAFTREDVETQQSVAANPRIGLDAPAYLLFTSGSTGVPKGVVITHANVEHFLRWAVDYFELSQLDRLSAHPPLHFDLSVFDIFGAFAAGAELHLVPPETSLLPNKVAEFIRESQLTQWFSVPSVLSYMAKFDVVRPGDFPSLRRVIWCGEVLPTPALRYWMTRLPHVRFTNLYGPTETTIASSYFTVPQCPDDDQYEIPIGTPCVGEELLVLDERLDEAPRGTVGELYIGGVGLSPGYWREPQKTESVFVHGPTGEERRIYRTGDLAKVGPDGQVYFLGRADSQIKSRGYRIELGEIEHALHGIGWLHEVAVVAVPSSGFEGTTICCAYVPGPGNSVSPAQLRTHLAQVLPSYMLPARWLELDRLPKNANGKVDRPGIREMFLAG